MSGEPRSENFSWDELADIQEKGNSETDSRRSQRDDDQV